MHKEQVKQTFEGFAEINDISKSEEKRFKELIDEMDKVEDGVEGVTASEEVIHFIGKRRDQLMDDLGLESDSDAGILVLSTFNDLITDLRPEREKEEWESDDI